MQRLASILDRIAEVSGRAVSWLALLMVLVGAWNALARWGGRYIGVDLSSNSLLEGQWYMFSVIFLLGASYTLKHGDHVRVDVLYSRLDTRSKAWVDLLGTILLLFPFCIFVIIVSWPGVVESIAIKEQSPDPGGLPRYPLKALVPVAFLLLMLQGLAEVLKRIRLLSEDSASGVSKSALNDGARDE